MYGMGPLLQPLDATIRTKLIPALTGQPPPNNKTRDLLALPARLGGNTFANPTSMANTEFLASSKISHPLKHAILQQSLEYSDEREAEQLDAKAEVRKLKQEQLKEAADSLKQSLSTSLQRPMNLARERGASTWLTSLPIQEFGFALHKRIFQDAPALHYNWRAPSFCTCEVSFSVEHTLSRPKRGFPTIRHNEIRI